MYLEHFALKEFPFSQTPNPSFYVNLASHHEALNVLLMALRSGEGFVKISGEVGTGKTLLCRMLLAHQPPNFVTAFLPNPELGARGLQMALAEELGIPLPPGVDSFHLLKYIQQELINIHKSGNRTVVLVDEAQALPKATLESLRLLSNLESHSSKLLQVVLFGQPELDQRLAHPSMRQLRQRIVFSHKLMPIDRSAIEAYVMRRLAIAGNRSGRLFTPSAITAVQRATDGVPRLVNLVCHKALLSAYGRGEAAVQKAHVKRAVSDTDGLGGWKRLPISLRSPFPRRRDREPSLYDNPLRSARP